MRTALTAVLVVGGLTLAGCGQTVAGTASPAGDTGQTVTTAPSTTKPPNDDFKEHPDFPRVLNANRLAEVLKNNIYARPNPASTDATFMWSGGGVVDPPGTGIATFDMKITAMLITARAGRTGAEAAQAQMDLRYTNGQPVAFEPVTVPGADAAKKHWNVMENTTFIRYAVRVKNALLDLEYSPPSPSHKLVPTPTAQSEAIMARFVADFVALYRR
ncbi:hypothetical protein EV193_108156 [Herbihabitans rhizosphaerae]|uniref:Lipoprotein n=1 Tax=Herbihabitans rhizosphaerae TaxID=1872711 RepID=A0A4V2ES17_9PSEU|nr:hypothetical protein [Herbihabitans rhizosphaerae]RZS34807.1 hypothetical protein EV193_108156 [Herbihabitans rhizosphaerae]